jgi:hypothetical protein
MTKQHKAAPDEWAQQEDWANRSVFSTSSCIIELRDRIEALEVGQQPLAFTGKAVAPIKAPITRDRDETGDYLIVHDTPAPASSLVERVADAIAAQATSAGIVNDRPARAAILEVATWLRNQDDGLLAFGLDWATRLQQEANQ